MPTVTPEEFDKIMLDRASRYPTTSAENVAAELGKGDPDDDWTYEAHHVEGDDEGLSVVRVIDEDGEIAGYWNHAPVTKKS